MGYGPKGSDLALISSGFVRGNCVILYFSTSSLMKLHFRNGVAVSNGSYAGWDVVLYEGCVIFFQAGIWKVIVDVNMQPKSTFFYHDFEMDNVGTSLYRIGNLGLIGWQSHIDFEFPWSISCLLEQLLCWNECHIFLIIW